MQKLSAGYDGKTTKCPCHSEDYITIFLYSSVAGLDYYLADRKVKSDFDEVESLLEKYTVVKVTALSETKVQVRNSLLHRIRYFQLSINQIR